MHNNDPRSLHAAHVRGVVAVVSSLSIRDMARNFGVLVADLELLTQRRLWTHAGDRRRLRMALEAVMLGSLDCLGLPRFELPAEYIAAWIVALVAPENRLAVCAFFDRPRRAADLASQESRDNMAYEGLSPSMLFSLVWQCCSDDPKVAQALNESCHAAVREAAKQPDIEDDPNAEDVSHAKS